MFKALAIQLNMFCVCYGSQVSVAIYIVAFTHLSKSPAKSQISIWLLFSQSKGVDALLFKLNYIVWYAYAFKNQGHKNSKLPVTKLHDLSRVSFERTWQQFSLPIFTSDASQCEPFLVLSTFLCSVEPEI